MYYRRVGSILLAGIASTAAAFAVREAWTLYQHRRLLASIRQIVEKASTPVLLQENGNVIYANPASVAYLGTTQQRLVGGTGLEHLPQSQRRQFSVAVDMMKHQVLSGRSALIRSDKDTMVHTAYYTIPVRTGRHIAVVVILTPVLHPIEQGGSLEQRANEEYRHQLESLIRGVVHDVKNALGAALAYIQLSELEIDSAKHEEALRHAEHTIRFATHLSNQMVLYTGNIAGVPRLCEVGALFRDIIPLLHASVSRSVQLIPSITPEAAQALLEIDPTHFRQMILNLVLYAAEGRNAGDQISLDVYTIPGYVCMQTTATNREVPLDVFTEDQPIALGLGLVSLLTDMYQGRVVFDGAVDNTTFVRVHMPRAVYHTLASGENENRARSN